jgi:hypothetical protein
VQKVGFKDYRIGFGRGSVSVSAEYRQIFIDAVRSAAGAIVDEFEQTTDKLERDARASWPTRQKRYGRSQDSRDQFSTGLRVIPPDKVQAFVRNSAAYAWAIYAGSDGKSDTTVPPAERVADVLLWRPAKHAATDLADRIADQMVKNLKRKG